MSKGLKTAPARTYSPQEITNYYRGRIDALDLSNVRLDTAYIDDEVAILKIVGGFNGNGVWEVYCDQIKTIVRSLNAYVISLENDVLDDVWYLQVNCKNKLY